MRNPFAPPVEPPAGLAINMTTQDPDEETWEKWEARTRKQYPVRCWLSWSLPTLFTGWWRRLVKEPWYWVRTHTYNRYHIIDMRYPRNGYEWGWLDRDRAILFASFAVLVDFVEKEYPGYVNWESDDEHKKAREEFIELYNWWTAGRKVEHDAHDKRLNEHYGNRPFREVAKADRDRLHEMSDALDKKDQEMLHRLIEVRGVLWT